MPISREESTLSTISTQPTEQSQIATPLQQSQILSTEEAEASLQKLQIGKS